MIKLSSNIEKAIAAIIVVTALFASLSVIARFLNTDFTILQQVYLRAFAALLISFVVFRKYFRWNKIARLPRRDWVVLAFRGCVSYLIAVPLISWAANTTLLGNVAFISALPFVPLLGFLFMQEKVTWWKIGFIFTSLLGVSLLAMHDLTSPWQWGVGDLIAIFANLAFALSYVSRKWHTKSLNNQEMTTLTFIFGVAFGVLVSFMIGDGIPKLDSSWTIWLAVFVGGIFNVVTMLLINYSFQHLDTTRAGNMLNLQIAWGLLFGFLIYQEWPTWQGLVGGAIIVASVVGMNIYSKHDEAKMAAIQEESST